MHASEIVILDCWLRSKKEHDKCAKLVVGCSQTVRGETGLQRIGVEVGGGTGRPCAATVTCRTWHGSRRVAGGEKNTTHRELWVWGLGEQDGLQSWRFFPRLYQRKKKMKSREMDLPSTIRVVAHSVFVCATERNAYILNICTIYTVFIQ